MRSTLQAIHATCNHTGKKVFPLLLFCFCWAATLPAQAQPYRERKVSIQFSYETLSDCLKQLQSKSGIKMSYNENEVSRYTIERLEFKQATVEEVLTKLLQNTNLQFREVGDNLVLFTKTGPPAPKKKRTRLVNGVVLSQVDQKPVAGVSVQVKGSFAGTTTGADGAFILSVPDDKPTLLFSSSGYEPKEVVAGEEVLNVTLAQNTTTLDNVVIIGYGKVQKKDVTGSVSSVSGNELNKMPVASFDASLVGRATGVHVVKASGAPGAAASIRIRGGTSAIGTNEPLYVIDGIPIEMGDGFGNAAYQESYLNRISPLASLNPEDIESVDILKDASATAIYGSRAANGVVIVTTKRGKKGGKPNITLGYNSSFDQFIKQYGMLDAAQYHQVVKEAYQNANATLPATHIAYRDANTNWIDETTHTGITNNAYVNINGGNNDGSTLYSFSGGLNRQGGVIKFTDFKRQNVRASLETTLFDKLRFGTNINFSNMENNGSGNSQFYTIMKYRPDVPLYDQQGNFGASPDSVLSNPYARISQLSRMRNQNVMTSFFGEIEPIRGLQVRSSISATINKGTNERYTPSTDVFEIRNGRRGSRNDYAHTGTSRIFDNTITYIKRLNQHYLNLVGGLSFTKTKSEYTTISSTGFQDDHTLNNLGSASSIQTYSSGGGISGLSSYFLRTNYNFQGKYYLTFTGRADHSTKFGPNNRWGYFPSGALAWRLSQEPFFKGIKHINDLKLRTSYGKTGSANFSDFQYATFFGTGSFYFGNNGVIANTIPNPDIKWESTYQLDAALDLNLFNSKLKGSVGYFQKTTKGMILNREIIRETGGTTQFANMGDFLNKGWELQIGSELIQAKHFTFISDLNITRYRSKVLQLNDGFYLNLREGQPISYFSGYKVDGIFQSADEITSLDAKSPTGRYQSAGTKPGDFRFVDINGDGFIGDADNQVLGKAEPDFYGGWNNVARFKNLELTAFFNFSVGNWLYNSGRRDLVFFTSNTSNYSVDLLNAWRPDNAAASLPRNVLNDPNRNRRDSDFFIENASFVKLKNLQLSYVLDAAFLRRAYVSGLRAYATVSNVFTITNYSGLDPEVNSAPSNNFFQGVDNNIYPQTRTLTLGVNVNF